MTRKKSDDPPENELTDINRVEERIERVPLTPEQVQERMHAAGVVLIEAQDLDAQVLTIKDDLKEVKQRAEAKHSEVDRIVLDAQSGTAAAPYPVIVERHPHRPTEMVIWRTPDGVEPDELLATPETDDVDAYFAAREEQGCLLVEQRAMTPDEMRLSGADDERRANPELPFAVDAESSQEPTEPSLGADEVPVHDGDGDISPAIVERKVLAALAVRDMSVRDIIAHADIDAEAVRAAIERLVAGNKVAKSGSGRGVKYGSLVYDEDDTDDDALASASYEA